MNEYRKTDAVKTIMTGETPSPDHDAWLRAKVENSIAETDKGARIYPAEEVWAALGLDD